MGLLNEGLPPSAMARAGDLRPLPHRPVPADSPMSGETWSLWIRAETEDEASAAGKAWADAEPRLTFEGVVSVTPREFHGVWTVVVAASTIEDDAPTLGLAV